MSAATRKKFEHELRRAIPLNTLSEAEFSQVLENSDFVSVAKGEQVMRQGDTDHFNVYLLKGTLSLHDKAQEVDRVSARESSARFPIAHQVPRKYSVRAEIKSEIARVDNRLLGELLLKQGDASYKVEDFDSRSKDDWMSQLLRLTAFQQVPAANMQGVMLRMEEIEVEKGQTVIREGDEGDYFYLVNQGRCQVTKMFLGEEPQTVAELGPGDSFGEEALLSNKPRGSSVAMLTDGVLVRLSKEDFLQFVKHPVTKGVRPSDAEARIKDGAVWLDIRSQAAWEKEHLQDSINIPLPALRYQASSLAPETTYIVCCDDGQLSSTAAFLLRERGLDALVLTGGLSALSRAKGAKPSQESTESETPRRGPSADDVAAAIDELKSALATSNASLKSLEGENLAYREEVGRLQDKLGAGKAAVDALQSELESVRREGAHAQAQQNTLAEERIQRLEREKGRFTEMLTEASAEQERLAEELAQAQQANQSAAAELTSLRTELSGQTDELERERGKNATLEQALTTRERETKEDDARHGQKLERLQQAHARADAARRDAEQALALLKEQNERTQQEAEKSNQALKGALEESSGRAEALEKSLSALQSSEQGRAERHAADMAAVQKELDQEREERNSLSARLASQESNQATLRAERDELARETREHTVERERAAAQAQAQAQEIVRLGGELEHERSAGETTRQRLEALEATLDETGLRLRQAESELEEMKTSAAALDSERLEKESEMARLEQEQRRREEALIEASENARQDTLAADARLAEKQAEADRLSAQIEVLEAGRREADEARTEALDALRAELARAEARTGELEDTLTGLQTALENREHRLRQAEERAGVLEATVMEKDRDANEQMRAQAAEIEALRASLEGQAQLLASERGASARERSGQDASIAGLEEEKASLERSVEALRAEKEEIEAERVRLAERLSETDRRHDESAAAREREMAPLRERLAALEAQTAEEAEARQRALAERDAMEQAHGEALSALRVEIEAARRESDQDRELAEGARSEITGLQSRLSEMESDADALRSIVAELREQNQELRAGIETEEASALKSELHLVRAQASSEAGSLERQVNQLTEALDEARRNNESALDETTKLEAQLADREAEIGELRESLTAAERLAGNQDNEVEKRENTIHRQHQHIAQLKRTAETRHEAQAAEIKHLKRSLQSAESRIRHLEQSVDTSEKEKVENQRQISRLQVRLNSQQDAAESGHLGVPPPAKRSWGLGIAGLLAGLAAGALSAPHVLPGIEAVAGPVYERFADALADRLQQTAPPPKNPATGAVDKEAGPPVQDAAPAPSAVIAEALAAASVTADTQTLSQPPVRDRLRNGRQGPEMIELPAGVFSMGSERSPLAPEEQPEHQVEVDRFLIGRYEVTFDEYALFASATGRRRPDDNGWGRGNRPVVNVRWSDAVAYASWLSHQTGERYRLPSEAEWEYAARAGTDTVYWWGYQPESNRANCFNCGSEWDGRSTAPVGSFEPNPYDVHDTAGNVMEWVADCFHGSYKGAPKDGLPWTASDCSQRMIRGGAFNKPADSMTSTKRLWNDENAMLSNLGFRLARDVDQAP